MTKRDPDLLLRDMRRHAAEAIAMCEGRSRYDLDSERMLSLALVRLLEIVGEAAARVPEDVKQAESAIPWAAIVAMRNRLIHGYASVDHDIVWQVVQVDLPALVAALDRVLIR
jgi:uncharacterized protein with HEPN domain